MSTTINEGAPIVCIECGHPLENGECLDPNGCADTYGYTNNTGQRLRDLAASWYDIATNEAVDAGTRHGYRECANQLEAMRGAGTNAHRTAARKPT